MATFKDLSLAKSNNWSDFITKGYQAIALLRLNLLNG
jgi:hypothetical protein